MCVYMYMFVLCVCVHVQAEIERMFKSEELAREHRQSLLKQHEQIAKMQKEVSVMQVM